MNTSRFLSEKTFELSVKGYRYAVNPSFSQLLGFVRQNTKGILADFRYAVKNGDVYIWDGTQDTHDDFLVHNIDRTHQHFDPDQVERQGYLVYDKRRPDQIRWDFNTNYSGTPRGVKGTSIDRWPLKVHEYKPKFGTKTRKDYYFADQPVIDKDGNVISEARIKDPRLAYLENPTKNELIGLINRSKADSIRLLVSKDGKTLYAWDAYDMWHDEFRLTILGEDEGTPSNILLRTGFASLGEHEESWIMNKWLSRFQVIRQFKTWYAIQKDQLMNESKTSPRYKKLLENVCDNKKSNKPWRTSGENKKFAVCAKEDGKTKLIRFGDPNMEIKRDDPERRKNFRARHSCDEKKSKLTAGYWSCQTWQKGKSVSDVMEALQIMQEKEMTKRQQRYLFSKESPLSQKQKDKLASEIRDGMITLVDEQKEKGCSCGCKECQNS